MHEIIPSLFTEITHAVCGALNHNLSAGIKLAVFRPAAKMVVDKSILILIKRLSSFLCMQINSY